jgi:hypothetical protein
LLNIEKLRELLISKNLTRSDKVILCLGVKKPACKSIKELKKIAVENGLRQINRWNVSSILSRSNGRAVRTKNGWQLTTAGHDFVAKFSPKIIPRRIENLSEDIRKNLAQIKNKDSRKFVEESVNCFDAQFYRASVVLSWIGTISLIYEYVINNCLGTFNSEAQRRNAKWKPARNADDIARMKDREFLDIMEKLSIIGKNTKPELLNCLSLRNACGHPSSLRVSVNRVAAHLEILILNVYSKF